MNESLQIKLIKEQNDIVNTIQSAYFQAINEVTMESLDDAMKIACDKEFCIIYKVDAKRNL